MGTGIIKKNTAYILFFLCHKVIQHQDSSEGGIREWPTISTAHVASFVITRITHQGKSAIRTDITHKISTVIKSNITIATQSKLMLVTLSITLQFRKSMTRSSSNSSTGNRSSSTGNSSPVVTRSSIHVVRKVSKVALPSRNK